MNKDNAKDYLPLVQALVDGRTIQYKARPDDPWNDMENPYFVLEPGCYRVKPIPIERWGVVNGGGRFISTYGDEETAAQQAGYYYGRHFLMREVV